MEGSVAVALNNPSNLKLGQLGHIAGGNANNTSATSLASTCRGSASSTSMWGDFKIGTVTISSTKTAGGRGTKTRCWCLHVCHCHNKRNRERVRCCAQWMNPRRSFWYFAVGAVF